MKPPTCSNSADVSPPAHNMNSDAAAAGCLSGVFRRLICGTLDMGSSRSRVADAAAAGGPAVAAAEKAGGFDNPAPAKNAPPAPGVVARLMGLESMPAAPGGGAMGRSRSTGSVEGGGWPVLLPVQAHRRSQSFRETPTFLRPENEEFLLLSFCAEDRETSPPTDAKHKTAGPELEPAAGDGEKGTKVRPSKTERAGEKTEKQPKTETAPEKARMTRRSEKKKTGGSRTTAEHDHSSQNSSPLSVLDRLWELDGEYVTDTSTAVSDVEEEVRSAGTSRRKLSSELDCFDDLSPFVRLHSAAGQGTAAVPAAGDFSAPPSSSFLWEEARRVAEREAQSQPWKTQDPKEIAAALGLLLLESLLHETVGEFCHERPAALPDCTW